MRNQSDAVMTKTEAAKFFRVGYTTFITDFIESGKLPLYKLPNNNTVILLSDCLNLIKSHQLFTEVKICS